MFRAILLVLLFCIFSQKAHGMKSAPSGQTFTNIYNEKIDILPLFLIALIHYKLQMISLIVSFERTPYSSYCVLCFYFLLVNKTILHNCLFSEINFPFSHTSFVQLHVCVCVGGGCSFVCCLCNLCLRVFTKQNPLLAS